MKKKRNRMARVLYRIGIVLLVIILAVGLYVLDYYNLLPQRSYEANDFGITILQSDFDKDNDGIDDYMDIMLGARAYVDTKPEYDATYVAGGYPPEGKGVCTDVIWKAFEAAGYNLKALVDKDIAMYVDEYPRVKGKADSNIDFRRVQNLQVFFEKHANVITIDISDLAAWQPGDIVIYYEHIAIVSDKRNKKGLPYIIHHGGQPVYEEDALIRHPIVGHYRWK